MLNVPEINAVIYVTVYKVLLTNGGSLDSIAEVSIYTVWQKHTNAGNQMTNNLQSYILYADIIFTVGKK